MGLKIATYNNTALSATMTLESTGDGSGVSTLRMTSLVDTTLTLSGTARFYTDAAGTLGESTSWTITAGALRTIYLKAPSGSSTLTIPNRFVISQFGNGAASGWDSSTNAARLVFTAIDLQNLTRLRIAGTSTLTGALPTGLTYLYLFGNSIAWTYSGALPTGLTFLYLLGNSIDYTGANVSGTANITTFTMSNFRISKMTDAELITLLQSMTNRVGGLPAAAIIGDIANPTSTDAGVLAALSALQAAKGTVVTRQA